MMQPTGQILKKNELLETLSRTSPFITAAFYSLLTVTFLLTGIQLIKLNPWDYFWLYVSGMFSWTLIEYLLHRYIFHIDLYIPSLKRIHFILHAAHHANPNDKERMFMPPLAGLLIALGLLALWFPVAGYKALIVMAGITTGYLLYAFIHYSLHTKPTGFLFKRLWAHHAAHHYHYPDRAFGVSSPLWDVIFGTMPKENNLGDR